MPFIRVSRRTLLAGAVGSAAFADAPVRLPRRVRVALWGLDGHPNEITGPLDQFPDVEIAGIFDANTKGMEQFVKRNQRLATAKLFGDPRRMLDDVKPDLVAVCNSDGDRAAGVLEAARRGLPVMAEKPLATKREDLEHVKKAVAASRVKVGMLLPMRYDPPYLALKRIVESGEIGEVLQISSQKSYTLGERPDWMKKRSSYGSTILWIGPHMIDLMRWTSGLELTHASSFMGQVGLQGYGDMENSTATAFRLSNGGTASLNMDYCRPTIAGSHGDDRLRLAGTKGVAEYMAATGVTLMNTRAKLMEIRDLPRPRSVFAEFLEHVYLGKPTSLPLKDIYRVSEIALAAHEAAVRGRVIPT